MSPNCECGHERGDHGPKMWGCAHCPCTEYEARTPAPSPTLKHRYVDRPPLVIDEGDTPSASPEADGGSFTFTVSTPPVKRAVLLDGEQWVPKSELARVQRERDEARGQLDNEVRATAHWQYLYGIAERDGDSLRAQLAAAEKERDEAKKLVVIRTASRDRWKKLALHEQLEEMQSLRAERDAALDRARVAEQRIETGVVCWRNVNGAVIHTEPTPHERAIVSPFTRGRFVADTEDKA